MSRCDSASEQDVDDAIAAAQAAFTAGTWSRASRDTRAGVLDRAAELLAQRLPELTRLEVRQTGRAVREMEAQLPSLLRWFRYYAGVLRTEERAVLPTAGALHNHVDRVALGVVVHVTPFNHPLLIAVKKLAPALAAGNSVVLKPSELAPLTALALAAVLADAGLPDGVLSVLPGPGAATGRALVRHPLVRKVDITAGTAAGRAVGAVVGANLARYTAELGGKAPLVVFEDAHVDAAVNGIAFGAFVAAGQTCVAATRIIVHTALLDAVLAKLRAKCALIRRRMGSPFHERCAMGPLISARQLARVEQLVAECVGDGEGTGTGRLVCGGARMTVTSELDGTDLARGFYYPPTVLVSASADGGNSITRSRLWTEEAFGPVVVVVGFDTEDEAVRLANDSEFALGAALWTRDLSRAFRLSQRIAAGVVWVNTHHRNDPSSPWGGASPASGVGSENGLDAYYAYTTTKSVVVNYSAPETAAVDEDWFRDDDDDDDGAARVRYG